MSDTTPLTLRVYADTDGRVYLLDEPTKWQVEVETPVTDETLAAARLKLYDKYKQHLLEAEGDGDAELNQQQQANRQIKTTINPPPIGFLRFLGRLGASLFQGVFAFFVMLSAVGTVYKGVELSQERLPEKLHLVVLFLYAVGLTFCIYLMATEEIRRREIKRINFWFGPNGLLFLPFLTLVVAASVFASLTLTLYNNQLVALQPCPGVGLEVAPGALLDFYIWHFFKLVPFLKLNETLKWGEPLCYTQARVGFLILLFQALVVLPSINTVRFYWRNRQELKAKPYKYIYEPGWRPESNLKP